MTDDPATVRATADATVERAAAALRDQLKRAAALIDPFPPFPGAMFAYGLEVEPPGGGDPETGCVILGDDGALYELRIGLDATRSGADAAGERSEELVPLDVPPVVYVAYAHAAIVVATDYLRHGGAPVGTSWREGGAGRDEHDLRGVRSGGAGTGSARPRATAGTDRLPRNGA